MKLNDIDLLNNNVEDIPLLKQITEKIQNSLVWFSFLVEYKNDVNHLLYWFVYLPIMIIQQCMFLGNTYVTYDWKADVSNVFMDVCEFLGSFSKSGNTYTPLYVALGITVLGYLLIVVCLVQYSALHWIWMFPVVFHYVTLCTTVLFIPVMTAFIEMAFGCLEVARFDVHPFYSDILCSSSKHHSYIAISLIFMFFYLLLCLFTSMCIFHSKFPTDINGNNSATSRLLNRVESFGLFLKVFLLILFVSGKHTSWKTPMALIMFLIGSLMTMLHVYYLEFYNDFTQALFIHKWLLLAWGGVVALFVSVLNDGMGTGMLYFIGLPLVTVSSYCLVAARYTYAANYNDRTLDGGDNYVMLARSMYRTFLHTHYRYVDYVDEDEIVAARRSVVLSKIETIMSQGYSRFPDHTRLHLFLTSYYSHLLNNRVLASRSMNVLKDSEQLLDIRSRLYVDKIALEQSDRLLRSLEVEQYIEFKARKEIGDKKLVEACKMLTMFWTELMGGNPQIDNLADYGHNARSCIQACIDNYEKLLEINSSSVPILRTLAIMNMNIIGDQHRALEYFDEADRVEQMIKVTTFSNNGDDIAQRLDIALDIFDERNGVISISLDPENLGTILEANASSKKILGFNSITDMVGNNVSCLMAPCIGEQHDDILLRFINTKRKSNVVGYTVLVLAMNRTSQYLIPLYANIRWAGESKLVGVLTPAPPTPGVCFCFLNPANNLVEHASRDFFSIFGFQRKQVMSGHCHLHLIFPELNKINDVDSDTIQDMYTQCLSRRGYSGESEHMITNRRMNTNIKGILMDLPTHPVVMLRITITYIVEEEHVDHHSDSEDEPTDQTFATKFGKVLDEVQDDIESIKSNSVRHMYHFHESSLPHRYGSSNVPISPTNSNGHLSSMSYNNQPRANSLNEYHVEQDDTVPLNSGLSSSQPLQIILENGARMPPLPETPQSNAARLSYVHNPNVQSHSASLITTTNVLLQEDHRSFRTEPTIYIQRVGSGTETVFSQGVDKLPDLTLTGDPHAASQRAHDNSSRLSTSSKRGGLSFAHRRLRKAIRNDGKTTTNQLYRFQVFTIALIIVLLCIAIIVFTFTEIYAKEMQHTFDIIRDSARRENIITDQVLTSRLFIDGNSNPSSIAISCDVHVHPDCSFQTISESLSSLLTQLSEDLHTVSLSINNLKTTRKSVKHFLNSPQTQVETLVDYDLGQTRFVAFSLRDTISLFSSFMSRFTYIVEHGPSFPTGHSNAYHAEHDQSYFFVAANGFSVMRVASRTMTEHVLSVYEDQMYVLTIIPIIVLCATITLSILCTIFLVRPIVLRIEDSKTRVLEMFLDIPRSLRRALRKKVVDVYEIMKHDQDDSDSIANKIERDNTNDFTDDDKSGISHASSYASSSNSDSYKDMLTRYAAKRRNEKNATGNSAKASGRAGSVTQSITNSINVKITTSKKYTDGGDVAQDVELVDLKKIENAIHTAYNEDGTAIHEDERLDVNIKNKSTLGRRALRVFYLKFACLVLLVGCYYGIITWQTTTQLYNIEMYGQTIRHSSRRLPNMKKAILAAKLHVCYVYEDLVVAEPANGITRIGEFRTAGMLALQEAIEAQENVLFGLHGVPQLNLKTINDIFYEDGCSAITQHMFDTHGVVVQSYFMQHCRNMQSGVIEKGAYSLWEYMLTELYYLFQANLKGKGDALVGAPQPSDPTELAITTQIGVSVQFLLSSAQFWLDPIMQLSTAIYYEHTKALFPKYDEFLIIILVCYCICVGFFYLIVLLPTSKSLAEDSNKVKSLMLLLPADIVTNLESVQCYILEQLQAD